MTKPAVFISSPVEGLALARELGRQLETTAAVKVWSEAAFYPGKSIAESLMEVADRSDFALIVLTPDYATRSAPGGSGRSNVIFELGLLAGRLGLSRTFVISDGEKTALPTHLAGIMSIPISMTNDSNIGAAIAPAAAVIRRAMADINTRRDRSPVEYYSSFISYSWSDQGFAARLHDDLRDVGVLSWLDVREIKIGDPWMRRIDKAIQAHDKVLLILSQASIQSSWVKLEVKNALRLERERQKTVLFPIRLDGAVFEVSGVQEIERLKERHIADFSHWQDKKLYQRAFSQLVRDLVINASVESGGH